MTLSAAAFGLVFGVAAQTAGFSALEGLAMSLLVSAGASQFAAVVAALVVSQVLIARTPDGDTHFHVGIEWLAIAVCVALVAWRRALLLGLVAAVAIVTVGRAIGLG